MECYTAGVFRKHWYCYKLEKWKVVILILLHVIICWFLNIPMCPGECVGIIKNIIIWGSQLSILLQIDLFNVAN